MAHMSKGDTQGTLSFLSFFFHCHNENFIRLNFTWLYLNINKSLQGKINTGNCSAVKFRVSLCLFVFYLCFSVSLRFPKKQLT